MTDDLHAYRQCEYCGSPDHDADAHGESVVIREGASTRTSDELSVVFLEDVAELYALTFPSRVYEGRINRLALEQEADDWRGTLEGERDPYSGLAHLPEGDDDHDWHDALSHAVMRFESHLVAAGYGVNWDDGYVIVAAVDDEATGSA